jgi:hypothetical protein
VDLNPCVFNLNGEFYFFCIHKTLFSLFAHAGFLRAV